MLLILAKVITNRLKYVVFFFSFKWLKVCRWYIFFITFQSVVETLKLVFLILRWLLRVYKTCYFMFLMIFQFQVIELVAE